jgi:hypothetical protein
MLKRELPFKAHSFMHPLQNNYWIRHCVVSSRMHEWVCYKNKLHDIKTYLFPIVHSSWFICWDKHSTAIMYLSKFKVCCNSAGVIRQHSSRVFIEGIHFWPDMIKHDYDLFAMNITIILVVLGCNAHDMNKVSSFLTLIELHMWRKSFCAVTQEVI